MTKKEARRFIEEQEKVIKKTVGGEIALVALSGGVDSSTVAVLAHRVIGKQLKVVFVKTGLMRKGEPEEIKETFEKLGIVVRVLTSQERFFETLKGITDPEEKRKRVGTTFIEILGMAAKLLHAIYFLQGTIKADKDEVKKGIKTHHNVLAQIRVKPEDYGIHKTIEPLEGLYKHEVRVVAKVLGLPKEIYNRMPFPGPGLAVRIKGEVTPERVEIVRKATPIVEKEIFEAGYRPFQAFPVLQNDKATGIKAGIPIYGNIISIRCVESKDALTAQPSWIARSVLERIRDEIFEQIPSVVKVTYDISTKPPSTIEWE